MRSWMTARSLTFGAAQAMPWARVAGSALSGGFAVSRGSRGLQRIDAVDELAREVTS
jgi:hypothetical protein